MYLIMILVFVLGYLAIALENNIKVDKTATALITGVVLWVIFLFGSHSIIGIDPSWDLEKIFLSDDLFKPFKNFQDFLNLKTVNHFESVQMLTTDYVLYNLGEHIIKISEILFFLIGAMTIVETIDHHEGFSIIVDKIVVTNKVVLLWVIGIITFVFSATLDNLTTSILMCTILKKIMKDKENLWLYSGSVIIAANAGGTWSPIGDITTIMLWIGGQITTIGIVKGLIIPSLICLIVPFLILSFKIKGKVVRPESNVNKNISVEERLRMKKIKKIILFLGGGTLLFVPIFKIITHLPPFMGILLGLGVMWLVTDIIDYRAKNVQYREKSFISVLKRIDMPTILFFLGILIAVSSLETSGHLSDLGVFLKDKIGNIYVIGIIIGLLSSIIDNVPLVAGVIGMYELGPIIDGVSYPVDHSFWTFLAYCAGTGGSCLIIGSAAGVAVMGIMKINFMWYFKKISILALCGYFAGAIFYILVNL